MVTVRSKLTPAMCGERITSGPNFRGEWLCDNPKKDGGPCGVHRRAIAAREYAAEVQTERLRKLRELIEDLEEITGVSFDLDTKRSVLTLRLGDATVLRDLLKSWRGVEVDPL